MGVFKIFNIVCFQCNDSIAQTINSITSSVDQQISIINFSNFKELENYCSSKVIHLLIIYIKDSLNNSIHFINQIRTKKQNTYMPVLFFYPKTESIFTLTYQIKFCEFISFPMSEKETHKFYSFFHYIYQYHLHNNTYSSNLKYMHLNLSKQYLKVPISKILFIEASEHKCILHTIDKEIPISFTLNKILQKVQGSTLIQSHRSFIVNIENIEQIDKSQEPWTIKFKNYEKYAFVSRSYKKTFQKNVSKNTESI